MTNKITLFDYGMCNLLNVARAFKHCDADILITGDPGVASKADKLVVPGVGAFANSMREIRLRGLDDMIYQFIEEDRPFLGICVGMQILFESSQEFGKSTRLGLLKGTVELISNKTTTGEYQRVPHIGWKKLVYPENKTATWNKTLLDCIDEKESTVYFVHSFAANPIDKNVRLADTIYGGNRIYAAVQKNNLMGTQFHPERSGEIGLNILRRFISL